MATTTATTPPAAEADASAAADTGRKKLVLIAVPLVAVLLGWFFFLGPGAGGSAEAGAEAKAPKAGEVLELEPITMNLADGRLLKVGLALQKVYEPKTYELSGSKALDEAITFLGNHTYAQLAVPAGREAAKAELSKRVSERYEGDVLEVYFTEFVMQ